MNKAIILFLTILSFGCSFEQLFAQGTLADYKRANELGDKLYYGVHDVPFDVKWQLDGKSVTYTVNRSEGKEFIRVDVDSRKIKPAFDAEKIAEKLNQVSDEKYEATQLPLSEVELKENGKLITFNALGKNWTYDLDTYVLKDSSTLRTGRKNSYWGAKPSRNHPDKVPSPDGKWEAFIKNSNVFIRSKGKPSEEIQLSFDGSEGNPYSGNIQWSPNSKHLATVKVMPVKDRTLYLIESSPEDQLQPKMHTRNYPKPGDALEQKQPVLFSVATKERTEVPMHFIEDQFSLSPLKWWKDSRGFSFEYNQRGHQEYSVVEMEAETGNVRKLIKEESSTFIDYSGKKYRYDVEDGKEIIWASERDGWNHLYLIDGRSGKVKNQITKGEWVVRKVIKVDEDNRWIIFEGSGKQKDQDPYFIQYYRIGFDGNNLQALTWENANHQAVFSEDYEYFVDTYSRLDKVPTTVLRSGKDGKIVLELEEGDISKLEAIDWKMPEVFSAKGRDGQTDIWGMIVRPTNFDPQKSYPVIEYIYAGPHSSFVPKSFSSNPSGVAALAELGFIVVQIDGMGTSNRSKAFHDVCYQNLKDAGFPDRIAWMKAAAEKYPYMDLDRVGIYGTSAGGQSSAGALLFHPDFYKVAVSSCGCHDNRMDKIWWNEQWMGKMGAHYAASSNTVHAANLEGKLMLIVGELDDNVDPASTYQFADALIKAKKDFELIMVPGMGHSSGGEFGERKRRDYFVRHLLNVEPPAWKDL